MFFKRRFRAYQARSRPCLHFSAVCGCAPKKHLRVTTIIFHLPQSTLQAFRSTTSSWPVLATFRRIFPLGFLSRTQQSYRSNTFPIPESRHSPPQASNMPSDSPPPTKAGLLKWWTQFTHAQNRKKDSDPSRCLYYPDLRLMTLRLICNLPSSWRSGRTSGLSKTTQRESEICKCADFDCKCKWRAVRLGVHTCRCGEMVSGVALHTLD
jgi:hypothetical protein